MKRSSYKSIIHLCILLFIILAVIIAACCGMIIYVVSTVKPDGQAVLNKWPIDFTTDFSQQIVFTDGKPQITDTGLELLAQDDLWLQVINESGYEVLNYNKPPSVPEQYRAIELLELYKSGSNSDYTPFIGSVKNNDEEWTYIIGFPLQISKVTMYVDAHRFTSGWPIILVLLTIATFIALVMGGIYGLWITRQLFRITEAVGKIASRSYAGTENKGVFGDVYESLNILDSDIRASDEERKKTQSMREEWITNITHDLKTPLSPIKGYAELLADMDDNVPQDGVRRYGKIILKNTIHAESLVDDLKLTYQLESGMMPVNRKNDDITRFLKEVIIDILNDPKYADRNIAFTGQDTPTFYEFDRALMQRAFNNLLYNAATHNPKETEIAVSIRAENGISIVVRDNGRGMDKDELEKLFHRYYRGTNTEESTQGTGLGMAIAKQIIELHDGGISVGSAPCIGTNIEICFPLSN